MKILHLPYGAGISILSRSLRNQGVDSVSCSFNSSNYYDYLADVRLNLNEYPPEEREEIRKNFFEKSMEKYDIFHFHFGETFYHDKRDLKELTKKGKKIIVHHRGSEVRRLSIARSFNNPYIRVKRTWSEKIICKNLSYLSSYVDRAIVNDHELLPYVEPYYKKTHIVPHAIDINQFKAHYPLTNDKPLIVHAPSHKEIKGTQFVLKTIKRLKNEGVDFTFKLIENLPHSEALKLYQNATIVIDQLRIGSYANLSLEAMAMGKPVICYIRKDLVDKYPSELPIVNANPDTIYKILKNLLNRPQEWKGLGKQGRQYIEKYHSLEVIAKQLISIYSEL
ncbi:glycosyltransferase family 4 protein [Priestia aryabhattai]|uniref:glycosyltransferase family 4 protein n=1 Tax=Priestia aryabhattai TaxID=412384 RepID=UPI003561FFBF